MKTIIAAIAAAVVCTGVAVAEPLKATATINCRNTPSTYGTVVASITKGSVVEGKATAGDWTRVDGEPDCWAATRYLVSINQTALGTPPRKRANSSGSKSYRLSKPTRLSTASSLRASRRATPSAPLFAPRALSSEACPCRGGRVCIGPRGGRYCITSGGNKRYGV